MLFFRHAILFTETDNTFADKYSCTIFIMDVFELITMTAVFHALGILFFSSTTIYA